MVRIEFDETKNRANRAKHGVDMALAEDFEFDTAVTARDPRRDYGEDRFVAIGYIALRLYVLVFTMRGSVVRVISLRRANSKERKAYDAKV